MAQGEAIFRPSSQDNMHLTLTWKLLDVSLYYAMEHVILRLRSAPPEVSHVSSLVVLSRTCRTSINISAFGKIPMQRTTRSP